MQFVVFFFTENAIYSWKWTNKNNEKEMKTFWWKIEKITNYKGDGCQNVIMWLHVEY